MAETKNGQGYCKTSTHVSECSNNNNNHDDDDNNINNNNKSNNTNA